MKQLIKQHKTDILKGVLILLWGIACLMFFQSKFCYHFYNQEQNQLFLLNCNYISAYLNKPAWLACLTGDFLTQFYYYMFAGPVILTLALLTLGDFTRRALERCFIVERKKTLMGWIAFAIAVVFMCYEARLCLDTTNHLSSIIGIIGGTGLFIVVDICSGWLFKGRKQNFIFATSIVLIIAVGLLAYSLFGIGFWFFFILELMRCPSFYRQYGMHRWQQLIHTAMNWLVPLAFILPFVPEKYNMTLDDTLTYPGRGKWVDYDEAMLFEKTLALDNEYYFGHYNKVVEMYEHMDIEPTDEMSFFYSLALSQMHMLPEKMMSMKRPFLGTFITISSETPRYVISIINELYYIIGDMTYTERAALLANTFSKKGRNARMIKRLAEANLINGDTPAAMKYLRLMDKTIAYHQWAVDHMPQTMSAPVKLEIENKQQFVNTTGRIRIGDSCYTILTQLLDSNPENLIALDYLLCSDMLSHERDTFVSDYEKYDGARRQIFEGIYESAKAAGPGSNE